MDLDLHSGNKLSGYAKCYHQIGKLLVVVGACIIKHKWYWRRLRKNTYMHNVFPARTSLAHQVNR